MAVPGFHVTLQVPHYVALSDECPAPFLALEFHLDVGAEVERH